MYADYVTRKYVVVLMDMIVPQPKIWHIKEQSKGILGVTVSFTGETRLREHFLVKKINKQQSIKMLGSYIGKRCTVFNAPADADLTIAQKALDAAVATVVADLLVLLCYHDSLDKHNIFFKPEPKKNTKKPPEYGKLLLSKNN